MIQRNNQPRVGVGNILEAGEEVRWSGNAGWDVIASFGAANYATKQIKIKYVVALDGCQTTNKYTTTNQKLAAATEGTTEGRCDEHDMWEKCDTIVSGAL